MTEATAEICNQCGRDVSPGHGWFVNRIPSDFGSVEEASEEHGTPFPEGAFQCSLCAADEDIFGGDGDYCRIEILDLIAEKLGHRPTADQADNCITYLQQRMHALNIKTPLPSTVYDEIRRWIGKQTHSVGLF